MGLFCLIYYSSYLRSLKFERFHIKNDDYGIVFYYNLNIIRFTTEEMGNSHRNNNEIDPNFPMQKYMNQGLNRDQILSIYWVFESYNPRNGYIDSRKYCERLQRS